MKPLLLTFLLLSCGADLSEKETPSNESDSKRVFAELLNRDVNDLEFQGDGYLWKAKFCAFANCDMDFFESTGRTYRTIDHDFWSRVSNTSWSGDMARCGLIPYALIKDNAQLKRHIEYGERVKWKMGDLKEGLSVPDQIDGASRVNYSPNLIASLYKARDFTSKGKTSIPMLPYSDTSKEDYKAHLRACEIFLDITVHDKSISYMERIVERDFNRVPKSPFYAYLKGRVNGEWQHIDKICKSDEVFIGDYIRCDGSESCGVAEKVFGCGLYLKQK